MNMDMEMNPSYLAALKAAEKELAGMDSRRRALQATIEGLRRLVAEEDQDQLSLGEDVASAASRNGSARPTVPTNFFKGKTPTQAYRDFVRLWGENHSVPEIRDALVEGGIGKSRQELLPALHSVVRRERRKAERARGAQDKKPEQHEEEDL